jgi:YVTN family beta-propeller protein
MKTKYPLPKGFSGTRRVAGILIALLALSLIAASAAVAAPFAYISNFGSGNISIIDAGSTALCQGTGQTPPCVVATVPIGLPGNSFPGGVAVNPAGTLAYVADQGDGTVKVIRTSDNSTAAAIPVGVQPWGVAVSGDGATVYVGLGDGSVAMINASDFKVTPILNVGGVLNGIVAAGSRVYVSDATAGQVVVIDANNPGLPFVRIDVGSSFNALPMGIVANAAGTRVYVVDHFQNPVSLNMTLEVSTIDTTSNPPRVIGTVTIDPNTMATPGGIALSPDESRLYVANDGRDRVTIVTLSDGTLADVTVGKGPMGVATDPAGRVYVANTIDGTVTVLDPNAPTKTVPVGSTPFVFGAFVTAGPPQFALTLNTIGSGSITAQPASATGKYDAGTLVALMATPAAGSQFSGWSGACSGSSNPCSVTMDAAKSVTATFTLKQYALTLMMIGTGAGSIAANPTGGTYAHGAVVAVTATPAAGSQFSGWSGACSGSSNPCNVTMDGAKSVTATVTLRQYALTLTMNGTGTGSIAANPTGGTYAHGTVVAVTATPATGSELSSWSGACSGSGACSVTMDAAKSVTATFTVAPREPAPTTCDDKINDLQKKVAADKHPWRHDHQLKAALRLYPAAQAELAKAMAKVGASDKRYVRALKEFNNGKAALCTGHYWRAHHELWESYYLAHEILKYHRR